MEEVLYFSKKNKNYYSNEDNHSCTICNNKIEGIFIYCDSFNKKTKTKNKVCKECTKKYKKHGILELYHIVIISEDLPNDCIPIFGYKPTLISSKSNLTVFGEAEVKNCKIVDNTKYSGREDNLFLEVEENKILTEKRIKELDSEASIDFFSNLKKTRII